MPADRSRCATAVAPDVRCEWSSHRQDRQAQPAAWLRPPTGRWESAVRPPRRHGPAPDPAGRQSTVVAARRGCGDPHGPARSGHRVAAVPGSTDAASPSDHGPGDSPARRCGWGGEGAAAVRRSPGCRPPWPLAPAHSGLRRSLSVEAHRAHERSRPAHAPSSAHHPGVNLTWPVPEGASQDAAASSGGLLGHAAAAQYRHAVDDELHVAGDLGTRRRRSCTRASGQSGRPTCRGNGRRAGRSPDNCSWELL